MDHGHHQVEKLHIGVEVAVRKVSHSLVIGNEDVYALEDCPVLDYHILGFGNFNQILKTLCKEISLKIVGPSFDILVIVFKIWVISDRLKFRSPSVMFGKHPCERGLAATYISSYSYMHIYLFISPNRSGMIFYTSP